MPKIIRIFPPNSAVTERTRPNRSNKKNLTALLTDYSVDRKLFSPIFGNRKIRFYQPCIFGTKIPIIGYHKFKSCVITEFSSCEIKIFS